MLMKTRLCSSNYGTKILRLQSKPRERIRNNVCRMLTRAANTLQASAYVLVYRPRFDLS